MRDEFRIGTHHSLRVGKEGILFYGEEIVLDESVMLLLIKCSIL
jgi:hypothetical protein